MAFNINEISSAIAGNNGLLYASHFVVMITTPRWANGESDVIRLIPAFCDSTELPGIGYNAENIRASGFGLFEQVPTFSNFSPINLTFYCDGNGKLIQFFQKWMQNIQNFNVDQRQGTTVNGAGLGVFNYPDWYETTIEIYQYNPVGEIVNTWKLDRAYPQSLFPIGVAWDQADQLLRLRVEFQYRAWTTEAVGQGNTPGSDSGSYRLSRVDSSVAAGINQGFQGISQLSNVVNGVLSTLYSPIASTVADVAQSLISDQGRYAYITSDPSPVEREVYGNATGEFTTTGVTKTLITFD